ncbi:MAG: HEAT repeat domain-containing protein [Gemmatimonadetes bacterium]|nr:HEAT repeat domain-containing protein [Gemmatimonadota bacterium]
MTNEHNDTQLDSLLAEARDSYRVPRAPDADALWRGIEAEAFAVRRAPARDWRLVWQFAAASLVIGALASNGTPRARAAIKAIVEKSDAPESLRITALDALKPDQATQEDVAWLQGLYGKIESARIRSRIISAMSRIGGTQNERWFTTLVNNENEPIEVRVEAMRRIGQAADIAALNRLYDQTGQRQMRSEIIRQLGSRKEPETVDKLGDIAKNGTDPELRRRAIEALSSKKDDPRAARMILQLIDRPED